MNTKNTPYTSVRMAKLPIALCYLFATSLWAQTADEIKLLQKSTDRHSLNKFSRQLKKNTLSAKQLQQKAMQKNLTFSGKVNGTCFQLMGFDTLGKPIYYTTYNRDAAIGTGADQLHQLKIYNLEGENITLHEWDGGGSAYFPQRVWWQGYPER